ncbi:AAA family ATPase [Burkholderiaceae bacterium DAT-1]|nr:AAA family ATPase [Burkholderiaceae bacterium DAT-1]
MQMIDRGNQVISTLETDQASSLRRMLARREGRSTALIGGTGTGVTSLAINLAHALAESGGSIMLIDEDESPASAASRLQLRSRHRFEQAVMRDVRLDEMVLQGPQFSLLPLHVSGELALAIPPSRQRQLADEYDSVSAAIDHVLIDARPVSAHSPPGLAIAADEVIVVITPSGESITDAYAAIKRLHVEYGKRHFRILVNRVRTLETAQALFRRVKEVAHTYLDTRLSLIGFVPEDDMLARADKLALPVQTAFPQAESSVAFGQLAANHSRWPVPQVLPDRANLLFRTLDLSRRFAVRCA